MSFRVPLGVAAIAVVSLGLGCADGRNQLSPAAPSLVPSPSPGAVPGPLAPGSTRPVDEDGDGYDDPAPGPMPDPSAPAPPPGAPPAPTPIQLTVNIVGTAGPTSFSPNPLQAAMGNAIIWTNADFITHIIVLDDGTPVGNLAPGQSSPPITLNTPTAGYHCTLHPSMVGQVTTLPPTSQMPPGTGTPPAPTPDPYGGGGGYDDGYEDDYYLKIER